MVRLVPLDVRLKLLLWNVEELLFEHGINLCYQTVRLRWHKFGPMFAKIPSGNGHSRDEGLNKHRSSALAVVRWIIKAWRTDNNTVRAHSILVELAPVDFTDCPCERPYVRQTKLSVS